MSIFGDLISTVFERRYLKGISDKADKRSITELCQALLGSYGEVSGVTFSRKILDRYARMDDAEKTAFFNT